MLSSSMMRHNRARCVLKHRHAYRLLAGRLSHMSAGRSASRPSNIAGWLRLLIKAPRGSSGCWSIHELLSRDPLRGSGPGAWHEGLLPTDSEWVYVFTP